MTEWANYDIDGKRVPSDSERAAFRAKEVDTGVPAPPGHASLIGVEISGRACHRSARSARDLQVILPDASMVHGACYRRKGKDAVTWTPVGG